MVTQCEYGNIYKRVTVGILKCYVFTIQRNFLRVLFIVKKSKLKVLESKLALEIVEKITS